MRGLSDHDKDGLVLLVSGRDIITAGPTPSHLKYISVQLAATELSGGRGRPPFLLRADN